jgi:hypothetical protein
MFYKNKIMLTLLNSRKLSFGQLKRLEKCWEEFYYIIDKFLDKDELCLKITGSKLNVYTVKCGKDLKIDCDCPDFLNYKGNNIYCKHICFVICIVGKIFKNDVFQGWSCACFIIKIKQGIG